LFSYHGLPNRQAEKCHPGIKVEACDCTQSVPDHGKFCYRATCFATSRLIAKELGLKKSDYSDAFQSRLSKNWLTPFSDKLILEKLKEGKKNILVFAPSFVTDCLETVIEIGEDYQELFSENGGNKIQLVESLNSSDVWVNAIVEIIDENIKNNNSN
jgi:ferrochelatase